MGWREQYLNRVSCGDCLELMKELPDGCIDLILTSPPFKDEDIGIGKNNSLRRVRNEEKVNEYLTWLEIHLKEMSRLSDIILMFNSSLRLVDICKRFNPIRVLVWNKKRTQQPYRYEPIFIFTKDNIKINRGIWNDCIPCLPVLKQITPYENPVRLYVTLIRFFPNAKIIFDPFVGSGTTAIAAEELGRQWIGFEIDSGRCKLAEARIAKARKQIRLPLEGR